MDYRLQIARRYLLSRRRVSLISVITAISTTGVTLGVAALIVVLSVMNGFYDFVRDLLVSFDPHVRIVSTEERGVANPDSLIGIAEKLPQVEIASAYVEGKALLLHEGETGSDQVVLVRGVDPASLIAGSENISRTGIGSFDLARKDGSPGVIVSMSLSQRLGLVPGQKAPPASAVGLLSAPLIERTLTQVFAAPPVQRYQVQGLFEMQAANEQERVFINIDDARRLFRMGDRVSGVDLRLADLQDAEAVKHTLQARLNGSQFTVQTWYDLQKSLYDVMQLEKWGASAILLLIVIVAAFNIVGSLTMVVIEKRRDVGVLQAMGVSRSNIRRIFLLEGLLIGIVGTGLGVTVGLSLALLQKHFKLVPMAQAESFLIDAYPVSVQATDVVLIACTALVLCVLAALYPSARASAIEPARAVHMDV